MGAAAMSDKIDEVLDAAGAAEQTRMRYLQNYEHPITCEKVTYTSEPIPVDF